MSCWVFLVQVFVSDQYYFEIVLFFAVTFQKYEKKKKCVFIQISYFLHLEWFFHSVSGTEMNEAFILASFPKKIKLVWLFPWLHKTNIERDLKSN